MLLNNQYRRYKRTALFGVLGTAIRETQTQIKTSDLGKRKSQGLIKAKAKRLLKVVLQELGLALMQRKKYLSLKDTLS